MEKSRKGEFDRSPSAETIGNNKDLITQVLLLVPARSLVRFKSVSKHWLSLISSSRFSMNHTRKNPKPPISGVIFEPYITYQCEVLPLLKQKRLLNLKILRNINSVIACKVRDVCNGLILCTRCNFLLVCNPTTRKYIMLPKQFVPVSHFAYGGMLTANLAFDPSESPHYKILLTYFYINFELDGFSYDVYIYSSESTSWEKASIGKQHGPRGVGFAGKKVFWNRAFHWIDDDKTHFRFDLQDKKLTKTPNPLGPQDIQNIHIIYNGNCGGRYFLLQTNNKTLHTCDLLEMNKDNYSWDVKHTVDFSLIECNVLKSNDYRNLNDCFSVLCVLEGNDGGDDLELVIATRDDEVIRYNLNSNNTEMLLQHSPGSFTKLFYRKVFKYELIESMFPL